jgi:hypothetical protein
VCPVRQLRDKTQMEQPEGVPGATRAEHNLLAPAEEDAGQWRSLNDLSMGSLFGASPAREPPALPLAAEREARGWGEASTAPQDNRSARAAAVALRSHAYGQQLLKRIMLLKCVPGFSGAPAVVVLQNAAQGRPRHGASPVALTPPSVAPAARSCTA